MSHLAARRCIVTGGSGGIGFATARILLDHGARVLITGRDADRLAAAVECLDSDRVEAVTADACDRDSWARVVGRACERWAGIDILVANHGAGIALGELVGAEPEAIDRCIALNLTSVIHGCRAVLPTMREGGGGHVAIVGSACSHRSWPGWSVYTAAKAGLVGFARCLHREMVEWGGKASFFAPGATRSGFQAAAGIEPDLAGHPDAADMAAQLVAVLDLPPHLVVETCSVWGTAQVLTPY